RAEHAVARRPAHAMAVDAGQRREELAAPPGRVVLRRRRLLRDHPGLKFVLGMHDHDQKHQRVLQSAILGALADVRSDPPRLDPYPVCLVGDGVHLSGQLGNQKLCATSTDWMVMNVRVGRVASLTGTWSSLAVAIPSFG